MCTNEVEQEQIEVEQKNVCRYSLCTKFEDTIFTMENNFDKQLLIQQNQDAWTELF